MSGAAAKITSVPSSLSFVDALAQHLLAIAGDDPLDLARTTILLPTRRAVRALSEAFLRATDGHPLLLPRMLPLGDLDADELLFSGEAEAAAPGPAAELPPAMPAIKRQLLLARLIIAWAERESGAGLDEIPGEDRAVQLAGALAALVDQVETEGLSFDRLADLVPEAYAAHWQTILHFLEIVTEAWPSVQRDHGCIGPAERRRRLLEARAEAWRHNPPDDPVIVAGSTGSIPATAELIGVVATLPRGLVVLPGLDLAADEEDWAAIAGDPTHPQHGMARLLKRIGVERNEVRPWTGHTAGAPDEARGRFVNLALLPAERTARWHALADRLPRDAVLEALRGVERIDCPTPAEEALVIALLLRGALEVPGRRAALVTPDRGLARRVAAELKRWAIEVDDSAGTPLSDTPPGVFLRATAEMMTAELAPVPLLAALKHPLAAGGLAPGRFRALVRRLEFSALRGPRPPAGFPGLLDALREQAEAAELVPWLAALAEAARPFAEALAARTTGLSALLTAHLRFAESLAASDDRSGAERLWAGEAGETMAGFVAEVLDSAGTLPPLPGARYATLLTALMQGAVVRPRYGTHPRLAILGPLEARLQHADVLILGGLNEGAWPAESDPGPWLSRPMRVDFGLPPAERSIGLAAHDFAQALSAPQVHLTRSTRVEGTPTVPSRWLLRLDAFSRALGLPEDAPVLESPDWRAVAAALDTPGRERRSRPPAPRPPVAARPRRLSVTQVETWMRDPYQLYARHVLKLRPLDPLDQDPGLADLGTLIHAALERFVAAYPTRLPPDPEAALIEFGRETFAPFQSRSGLAAFWWPRFLSIARWFAEKERGQRGTIARAHAEVTGQIALEGPEGPFVLTAQADRIDVLSTGGLALLDYKTGAVPGNRDVEFGFAPQLPLEAAIAAEGGFGPEIPAAVPARLEYWRLTGREPAGEIKTLKGDRDGLILDALKGLRGLIALFDREETPYHAQPRPRWAPRFNDYAHLERARAWLAGDAEGEGP